MLLLPLSQYVDALTTNCMPNVGFVQLQMSWLV